MRAPIHPVLIHPAPIHLAPTSQVATHISTLPNSSSQLWLVVTMVALLFAHVILYVPTVNAETTEKPAIATSESMVVYKSPSCGCCGAWIDHMTEAGFSSTVQHPKNLSAIKQTLGIAPVYQACHTATLQDYVFEGHIPADVIQHFLASKPVNAAGLAVAGMPMGSPGMDTDRPFDAYQVVQLNQDGSSTPYASVSASNTIYLENN
jgi:hypothetical protein